MAASKGSAVHEILARRPGRFQQAVARRLGGGPVAVGHHHRTHPGLGDVGEREAAEQGRGQHRVLLHLAGHGLDRSHRRIGGSHAQGLSQKRHLAPGHDRLDLAGQRAQQHAADLGPGLVHIDMGIGLVANHRGRIGDHAFAQIAVQVASHRDRQAGRDRTHARQQAALAVGFPFGDHGAVQVEQRPVEAAAFQRVQDAPGDIVVGLLFHRTAGHGLGGDRGDHLRADLAREIEVGAERVVRAGISLRHRLALVEAPIAKPLQIGGDRREGVGFVLHHGKQQAHDSGLPMPPRPGRRPGFSLYPIPGA